MLELSRLEDASRSRHTFGLPSGEEFGFELRFGGDHDHISNVLWTISRRVDLRKSGSVEVG